MPPVPSTTVPSYEMDADVEYMLNVAHSIVMMLSECLPSRTTLSSLNPRIFKKKKKSELISTLCQHTWNSDPRI